ncbi:FAD-dependent oxidoreductase [Microbacterium terricola]|uniref:Oxidoreductase n=1 Tax=Microbacterium terricola TaxID=344163 RepID=A0ABM8E360_9MICO|nr:NAD(P)/FAD-dependent oxidoreductase [Microbacterium terricola]UYK40116.1 FAD-dependent monooxygenase [Microbacterium terricola]BDV32180.1 oxidoreductase [Microbacterium terricola]
MADVIVVGAGPVGLLFAAELATRNVDVRVLERRPELGAGSRAIGVHAAVLAALEPGGTTERLLATALRVRRGVARADGRVLGVVRFDRLSTRFPFVATLPQSSTERALAERAPAPVRDARVTEIEPRPDAVVVRAEVGGRVVEHTARIVVVAAGAGGRALVLRPGAVATTVYPDRYVMTDSATGADPDAGVAVVDLDRSGVLESFPLPEGRRRFVVWDDPAADPSPDARAERLRSALRRRGEFEAADRVTEATGFGVRRVVSPRLRNGRVLVIGDAAHEVSPIGGQGMNLGLLDAVGLAPLVARWIHDGEAPDAELRRWEARRVASARTAARLATMNTALGRPLPRAHALRSLGVRAMLAPPAGRVFARAYSMGFDSGA